MLISGCCAVKLTPAVWVWNRRRQARGSLAPNVSRISRAQMRRAARYFAQMMDAGLLIVIDVLTPPTSIPLKRIRMSSRDDTATPHVPNSPFASGSSVSYPYRVGISKATLRPVSPWAMRYLNRRFVSSALPEPANIPTVHNPPPGLGGVVPHGDGETAPLPH